MSLIDAPAYDPTSDERQRRLLIGAGVAIMLLLILAVIGYVSGHGWLFSNVPAERKVNRFFDALQAKDYAKAYDIYENGHPDPSYSLSRFTEDWTTHSPVKGPILSHQVDKSVTDGSGAFGSGIIVAVRLNLEAGVESVPGEPPQKLPGHKIFMYVNRADGTLDWPAPHVFAEGL